MADVTYIIALRDRVSGVARKMALNLKAVNAAAGNMGSTFTRVGLITGIAGAAMFKYGAEIEKTRVAFATFTGSAEKGKVLFDELTEFANKTPFSNRDVNKNAQVLLAFGQKAETITGTLETLGDVAAGDSEKLRLVTLAFSQIQAAGRLMGQDLLQLINAGFNPLQEISEKTGVSMRVLKDRMSKGQISAELVAKAFKSATGQGGRFEKLTQKISKTMAGRFSTAVGKGQFLLGELGIAMKGIFVPLIEGAIKAIEFLLKYKNVIARVIPSLGLFTAAVTTLTGAFLVLNAVINANIFVRIILVIGALVAAIHFAATQVEGWGKQWRNVLSAMSLSLDVFVLVFKKSWKSFSEFFTGSFGKIKEQFFKLQNTLGLISDNGLKRRLDAIEKEKFANLTAINDVEKLIKLKKGLIVDLLTNTPLKLKADEVDPSVNLPTSSSIGASLDFGKELDKLKAEGVVSGNINTFNINISELKGIGEVTTNTVGENIQDVGKAVTDAILESLADVKVN